MDKKKSRLKRIKKFRLITNNYNKNKLIVNRTSKHIYAQITNNRGSETLISINTLQKYIKKFIKDNNKNKINNFIIAEKIGELIAKKSLKKNIKYVSFDRSGYKYHGIIKKLAESARKFGLIF